MANPDLWQKTMYDPVFANATIASRDYARIAKGEADFLIEAMGLRRGESLLDVPCGTGRHARVFAKLGVKVTGIDLNPGLIRMARRASPKSGIRYVVGDMLKLSAFSGKFDAVVNLFTSFGYFSDERKNAKVLAGMAAALKPGGRLAIHLIDRDWLLKRFDPVSEQERQGVVTTHMRDYHRKSKRIESSTTIHDLKSGRKHEYYHETRLYTKPELVRMMKAAGLVRVQVFGDTDGSLYRKGESSHPIYIGWKPVTG